MRVEKRYNIWYTARVFMEPCQSGLTYLFAKEAGCNSPREFESRRLRIDNLVVLMTHLVMY